MRTRLLSAVRLLLLITLSLGGCAEIIGLEDYSSPTGGGIPGTCAPASFQSCYTGSPETENANGCHAGVEVCNKDSTAWGPCTGEVRPTEGAKACVCAPGEATVCYEGPPGTNSVGLCAAGTRICDEQGAAFGPCEGATTPRLEDCSAANDANCDGIAACKGSYRWANRYGGSTETEGLAIATDAAGNVFVTGYLTGDVELGGVLTPGSTVRDVVLLKLDPRGRFLWSKRFSGGGAQIAKALAVDPNGNVFVTGYFAGTMVVDPSTELPNNGGRDVFVVGFSAEGKRLWAKSFGDAADQFGNGIAVDPTGDVIVTGSFAGKLAFGGPATAIQPAGNEDAFVAKLKGATGEHVWSKPFGGAVSLAHGLGIAIDSKGDIVVTGDFMGSVNFGAAPIDAGVVDPSDAFVAKLTGEKGDHVWSKGFGDGAAQNGLGVAVDSSGDVLLTGILNGSMDLGGGALSAPPGSSAVFVAKLEGNNGGAHVWSNSFGNGSNLLASVAVDGNGNVVLLVGAIQGEIDFGGGKLVNWGKYDLALAKFDKAGNHLWSDRFGGTEDDVGYGLFVDPLGNVLLTGDTFGAGLDFGGGALQNEGGRDLIVASFAP